ncbi:ABC transporter permease [Halalkalibacter nanhaiisediminis]|uniref:Peptide/nickel transport system permease protein n=1 Tax=Halalkalibacter nanhaiisediminis TaxID=688079 RepID=A0A562QQ48_9BACI|nr:ABC transporter permease [Halalkalibacter nanhaiisediminis]TWI58196.1 peptide/nickel transport system permease protein [Halalkalibacter nanhaiisediminis]
MKMYILKRILSLIPVLFIVSIVIFSIIHLTPGDPASIILGEEATEQSRENLREQLGLNLPIYQQYVNWIIGVLQGDLGHSFFMNKSVTAAIFDHIGPTLSLSILSQVTAIIVALPLGIWAAYRRGTLTDQSFMGLSLLGISIPNFILGLFLIILFAVNLQWLPVAGYQPLSAGLWNHLQFLIMPAIALGTMQAALIARMTRSAMLETLNANFIKTARSKGLHEQIVIYKHALKNAFIPILTVIGQTFGMLIAGAAVTETVFNIPGIGQLIINSVERRDYAVIQGTVLMITVSYVLINLVVDLLYGVIDPRVRLIKK